jgi:hypothetical protein
LDFKTLLVALNLVLAAPEERRLNCLFKARHCTPAWTIGASQRKANLWTHKPPATHAHVHAHPHAHPHTRLLAYVQAFDRDNSGDIDRNEVPEGYPRGASGTRWYPRVPEAALRLMLSWTNHVEIRQR